MSSYEDHKKQILLPLSGWTNRKHNIPRRFHSESEVIDKPDSENWSVWVSLEESSSLHRANEMNWLSLKDSIELTNDYLEKSSILICGLEGGSLDGEEELMIKERIGLPPLPCLPIYIITCKDTEKEEIVYIGKTKSDKRFIGGHTAALKLHDPIYNNKIKTLYRCSIWFYIDNEYIIIDWIRPTELALELLDSIESQLIYHFKPELNISKKNKNYTKWEFTIQIQNFLDSFLNDTFIWPLSSSEKK
jgi:hypothetical protein